MQFWTILSLKVYCKYLEIPPFIASNGNNPLLPFIGIYRLRKQISCPVSCKYRSYIANHSNKTQHNSEPFAMLLGFASFWFQHGRFVHNPNWIAVFDMHTSYTRLQILRRMMFKDEQIIRQHDASSDSHFIIGGCK